jgi:alcohol dehydrogenase (cytochrome c)
VRAIDTGYVPANENLCGGFTGEKVPLVPGQLWFGTMPEDIGLTPRPGATHFGELQAWDPATGKKAWSHYFPKSHLFGSAVARRAPLPTILRFSRRPVARFACSEG